MGKIGANLPAAEKLGLWIKMYVLIWSEINGRLGISDDEGIYQE